MYVNVKRISQDHVESDFSAQRPMYEHKIRAYSKLEHTITIRAYSIHDVKTVYTIIMVYAKEFFPGIVPILI